MQEKICSVCHKHQTYYRRVTTSLVNSWTEVLLKVRSHIKYLLHSSFMEFSHNIYLYCVQLQLLSIKGLPIHWMIVYSLILIFWIICVQSFFIFVHTTMQSLQIERKLFSIFIFMREIKTTPVSSGLVIQQISTGTSLSHEIHPSQFKCSQHCIRWWNRFSCNIVLQSGWSHYVRG